MRVRVRVRVRVRLGVRLRVRLRVRGMVRVCLQRAHRVASGALRVNERRLVRVRV